MLSKQDWGNATWYLFHTLAYKLKDGSEDIIPKLLTEYYKICDNLPCPYCSSHAISLLKRINFNNIKTRDKLILLLNEFHNSVNKRLNKKTMTIEESNNLYSKANTFNIVKNFINVLSRSTGVMVLMMRNMSKNRMVDNFNVFINDNHQHFNN